MGYAADVCVWSKEDVLELSLFLVDLLDSLLCAHECKKCVLNLNYL